MPTAFVPLLLALAAPAAPAIVLTPASAAQPLATRCGPASQQGASSEVECLIEQPRAGGEATPTMRILIRTTPATPCRALEAQAVAVPAAATPGPPRALPVVVQGMREPVCSR
jgi:hypothetical protein